MSARINSELMISMSRIGIHGAEFVDDVVVFETTDDLDDGVGFTDGGEELVAEARAFGGALDQAGDVHELDGGGHQLVGAGDFREHGEAGIGHGDDADVRIDGAEGIVGRLRLAGAGHGIEEGRFSDVGQSYDSGLEHGGGRVGEKMPQGRGKTQIFAVVFGWG